MTGVGAEMASEDGVREGENAAPGAPAVSDEGANAAAGR